MRNINALGREGDAQLVIWSGSSFLILLVTLHHNRPCCPQSTLHCVKMGVGGREFVKRVWAADAPPRVRYYEVPTQHSYMWALRAVCCA